MLTPKFLYKFIAIVIYQLNYNIKHHLQFIRSKRERQYFILTITIFEIKNSRANGFVKKILFTLYIDEIH